MMRSLSVSTLAVIYGRSSAFAARFKKRERLPVSRWLDSAAYASSLPCQRWMNHWRHATSLQSDQPVWMPRQYREQNRAEHFEQWNCRIACRPHPAHCGSVACRHGRHQAGSRPWGQVIVLGIVALRFGDGIRGLSKPNGADVAGLASHPIHASVQRL